MKILLKSVLQRMLALQPIVRVADFITRTNMSTLRNFEHKGTSLRLSHPNQQIRSRNITFSTKEPDTLRWIEGFEPSSTVWDIGANVGLYSIYAALHGHSVVSIEPSVFNLEFLVRNVTANDVSDRVFILPMAVGNTNDGFSRLNLKSMAWGDSQNAFATELGQSGESEIFELKYQVYGMGLDSLVSKLGIDRPNYIKLDVDGIEPDILESGPMILRAVSSVLVEVPTYLGAKQRIESVLMAAGLYLKDSLRRNQIWVRS